MKSGLGKKLRSLRLSSGLSYRALGLKTKISVQHLRNLEREKFEHLPAPVFVKGFLKKWAQVTNGNTRELHRMYEDNARASVAPKYNFHEVRLRRFRIPVLRCISLKLMSVILCVVVAVALFSYIYYTQFIAVRDPQIQVMNPADVDSVSVEQQIWLSGKVQNAESVTVNGRTVVLEQDGTFLYHYNLNTGLNIISFIATNEKGEQVKIIRNIVYGE